jgi:hypothetical protein
MMPAQIRGMSQKVRALSRDNTLAKLAVTKALQITKNAVTPNSQA